MTATGSGPATATGSATPVAPGIGQPLADVLAVPVLADAVVLAGGDGLGRTVERLNVMEVPDILPWVKPREFLLTTAYPLRDTPERLVGLVGALDDAGLAGLGVKLGRYLDRLPQEAIDEAERRGFPLVRLPDDVSFDDVFNEVLTRILHVQADRLARSERIHRAFLQIVLDGDGLDRIAAELAELLDAPTAVVDLDGTVLAGARLSDVAGVTADDDHDRITLDGGAAHVGDAAVACRSAPVSAGGRVHGHVVALAPADDPAQDRMALESAATVAALAVAKEHELRAVEVKYQSDLMYDLVSGRVSDVEAARARARLFGWDLDRRLIALVVRLDDATSAEPPGEPGRIPLAGALQGPLRDHDPAAAVVRFSDEVVALVAAFEGSDGRGRARRFAVDLARAGARTGAGFSIGVSRAVDDLRAIPEAYDQAVQAVHIGRRLHGPGAVAHFDDLGIHRLLSLVPDGGELRRFADETLGDLLADTEAAADLRETLRVVLETNVNVAESARRLHFHYNTLRYRIDKLEGLVGPFTADATIRLNVQVALAILEIRDLASG